MAAGLRDGVLHPRWMSEANRGFGSTALMNYPPLGGYLVGVFSLVTGDLVSAFQLVLLIMTGYSLLWVFPETELNEVIQRTRVALFLNVFGSIMVLLYLYKRR